MSCTRHENIRRQLAGNPRTPLFFFLPSHSLDTIFFNTKLAQVLNSFEKFLFANTSTYKGYPFFIPPPLSHSTHTHTFHSSIDWLSWDCYVPCQLIAGTISKKKMLPHKLKTVCNKLMLVDESSWPFVMYNVCTRGSCSVKCVCHSLVWGVWCELEFK